MPVGNETYRVESQHNLHAHYLNTTMQMFTIVVKRLTASNRSTNSNCSTTASEYIHTEAHTFPLAYKEHRVLLLHIMRL